MATWDGINSSIIANRFGNVYIKDYMDISGRLFVRRDASFNNRLFVMNDASFMGNLYADDYLTPNLNFTVNGDASLNGRLMVANDASFQGAITQVPDNFTLETNTNIIISLTSNSIVRANTGGTVDTFYRAYVSQTYSGNYFLTARLVRQSGTFVGKKQIGFFTSITPTTPYFGFYTGLDSATSVSIYFNNTLQSYTTTYEANDIFSIEIRTDSVSYYINNSLLIRYNNPNSVSLYPVFRMQYGSVYNDTIDLISIGTLASNVYVGGNLTAKIHFKVNGDAYLNTNLIVGKDVSCNGNISIGRNLTVGGNLAVRNYTTQNIINTTTTNYQLVIAEDLSLNGRLAMSSDTSLNGNLFVAGDLSLNGNLNIRTTQFLRDISVNGITIGSGRGGYTNTIFGNLALANNSTGINNTAVGYAALQLNDGSNNSACGFNALSNNTTGVNNTAIGSGALSSNTTGSNNTAIGYNAGSANVSGSYNTFIGYNANANADNYTYSTAIGANALITGSNQIVLGTSTETIVIAGSLIYNNLPTILFDGSNQQNLPANSTTTVLFPVSRYSGTFINIGYDNNTGIFTNNNPYTIGVTVSASVCASNPQTAGVMTSIISSAYGVVGSSGIYGIGTGQGCTTCTATFPMDISDNFYVIVRNTKSSAITINQSNGAGTNLMVKIF